MTLGLPYAPAGVDDIGYHVTCPECGFVCRAEASMHHDVEDDATKGANRVYAIHYEQWHWDVERLDKTGDRR